jgi:imidazoleglycerol phosphate dehydratase HisB
MPIRSSIIKRNTKETRITVKLKIDGAGKSTIRTGIPFFDHMLTLFTKHAVVDLQLKCAGDLEVDAHHTVEDCGIALGQAFFKALGDKRSIRRYGAGFDPANPFTGEAYVPMDECLARCIVDFSGRPYLVWRGLGHLSQKKITRAEKTRIPRARSDLAWRASFSRVLRMKHGATCTSNCFMAMSRIMWWSQYLRPLPRR